MNKTSKNNLLSACTLGHHNCAWKCSQKLRLNWRSFRLPSKDTVKKRWGLIYGRFTATAWTSKIRLNVLTSILICLMDIEGRFTDDGTKLSPITHPASRLDGI